MALHTRSTAHSVRFASTLCSGSRHDFLTQLGLFYAGYAALLTPAFGVADAYGDDIQQYNNAVGFFMICKP